MGAGSGLAASVTGVRAPPGRRLPDTIMSCARAGVSRPRAIRRDSLDAMTSSEHELDGLDTIAEMVARGEEPQITGRQLLGWFDAERRGSRIVARIRGELRRRKLKTDPDFNEVWVDVPIRMKSLRPVAPPAATREPGGGAPSAPRTDAVFRTDGAATPPAVELDGGADAVEPVLRIGRMEGANRPIVAVAPNTPIAQATTLMMLRDFSQLPVIQNDRGLKGAVTWRSIGLAAALGRTITTVNDCMVKAEEVSWDTPVLDAINMVVSAEFVLVRGKDKSLQGIITAADLSLLFRALSEPFLLLGQVENMVRLLVARAFTVEEMKAARNPGETSREVSDVSDLSFGEYVRLLEPSDAWPKLKVTFDREPFLRDLRSVHAIRNDVVHFDPDPLGPGDIALLRNFAAFLDQVLH